MAAISYRYCHFPPAVIQHALWLYARSSLSYRDVEQLLAERGIVVSYETVRRWVARFGPQIARRLRHPRPRPHSQWHLDEMFVSMGGKQMYLWRAIDRQGEVLDVLVQAKRDKRAALELMRKLLKKSGFAPWKSNCIEGSHDYIRRRECRMQGFRSPGSAQRFLSLHAATYNAFNTRRHLSSATDHRDLRSQAFTIWREAAGIAA